MSTSYNMKFEAPIVFTKNLFEPSAVVIQGVPKGEPKYSCNFVFPKDHKDLKGIWAAAAEAAKAGWPGRSLKEIHWPWHEGDGEIAKQKAKLAAKQKTFDPTRYAYLENKIVLPGRSLFQPILCGLEHGVIVDYETEAARAAVAKKLFYPGVEACGSFTFVPWPGVGTDNNVTCYLNKVLSLGRGVKLSFGESSQEAFSGIAGRITQEDPTGGAGALSDEAAPF